MTFLKATNVTIRREDIHYIRCFSFSLFQCFISGIIFCWIIWFSGVFVLNPISFVCVIFKCYVGVYVSVCESVRLQGGASKDCGIQLAVSQKDGFYKTEGSLNLNARQRSYTLEHTCLVQYLLFRVK